MIVVTGIFAAAETDDEIAAILSHELAHLLSHHAQADMSAKMLSTAAALPTLLCIGGAYFHRPLGIYALMPIAVSELIKHTLCGQHETEADFVGMLLMAQAGYDPTATVSVFKKLHRVEQEARKTFGPNAQAAYKTYHPHVSHHAQTLQTRSNQSLPIVRKET